MACSLCNSNPCNCSTQFCAPVECSDPGIIPIGTAVQVLDYKLCPRRLENSRGFLVCDFPSGGTPQIFWTEEPCVNIPILEIPLGEPGFPYINASLGEDGCMRRLSPAADGWLRAVGGVWVLSELPSENLPEPFEVENLIVNDTATIENLVIGATMCFDAPVAGTIVDNIGLNADGCLVTGTISQIEAALFYESATLTTASTPNIPIARNTNAIIGNEIFDPQSIASIVNSTRIKIDKAGTYLILWSGFFDHIGDSDNANGRPGLDLVINSSIVALSCGRDGRVKPPATVPCTGMHLAVLAINDTIDLKVNATAHVDNNQLKDVKLTLVKYRE